jgi:hypothetical protein
MWPHELGFGQRDEQERKTEEEEQLGKESVGQRDEQERKTEEEEQLGMESVTR